MSQTAPDEKVLLHQRTHPKVLILPFLAQILLLAGHIAILTSMPATGIEAVDAWVPVILHSIIAMLELALVVVPLARWWASTFTITSQRVIQAKGVLHRRSMELFVNRITAIEIDRSLADRLVGCGTLVLRDAGSIEPVAMDDIPHVRRAQQLLDDLRS